MLFRYTAVDARGALVSGAMDATDEATVVRRLQSHGLLPLAADPGSGALGALARPLRSRTPPHRALAMILHEAATLIEAGLPLDKALATLSRTSSASSVRAAIATVLDQVRRGERLSQAIRTVELGMPSAALAIIAAGEQGGGSLTASLRRAEEHLTRVAEYRQTVRSALVYPAILVATVAISLVVVFTVVLPQIAGLFDGSGKPIPPAMGLMLTVGTILRDDGWLLALVLAGGALAARRALSAPATRRRFDAALLRTPLAGDLVLGAETARFARTLGELLANGQAVPTALALAAEGVGNTALAASVELTIASVRRGDGLAAALRQHTRFPPLAAELVGIGEETSALADVLLKLASIYDNEMQRKVERLLAILVPALTLGLGALVAGVIASVLSAILSTNEAVF